jgi:hypothetical protein
MAAPTGAGRSRPVLTSPAKLAPLHSIILHTGLTELSGSGAQCRKWNLDYTHQRAEMIRGRTHHHRAPSMRSAASNGRAWEMAQKLRELDRDLHFAGTRNELLELALRYDQKADDLDAQTVTASD